MKKINRTLLLLAGITANILIACGSGGDETSGKPYPTTDTTRAMEYKNDPDTLPVNPGGETGNFDKATQ